MVIVVVVVVVAVWLWLLLSLSGGVCLVVWLFGWVVICLGGDLL